MKLGRLHVRFDEPQAAPELWGVGQRGFADPSPNNIEFVAAPNPSVFDGVDRNCIPVPRELKILQLLGICTAAQFLELDERDDCLEVLIAELCVCGGLKFASRYSCQQQECKQKRDCPF